MAKVIWEDDATFLLLDYIKNARIEYGAATVKRWQSEGKA